MAPNGKQKIKILSQKKKEILTLQEQHKLLERKIVKLSKRKTLTPQEDLEKKQLQKEKLSTKDRLQNLIRQMSPKS